MKTLRTKPIPLGLISSIVSECGASAYVVYSVLLCHARTKGKYIGMAFPSEELIGKEAGLSLRTVVSCIDKLSDRRFIRITKRKAEGGYWNNIYWIAWVKRKIHRWEPSAEFASGGVNMQKLHTNP